MKKFFYFTQMRALPISEYIENYKLVVGIFYDVEYSIESDDFEKALERVQSHLPELAKIKRKIAGQLITAEIDSIHAQLVNAIKGMKSVARGRTYSTETEVKESANRIHLWFSVQSHNLPYGTRKGVAHSMAIFAELLEDDSEFVDDLRNLGLLSAARKIVEFDMDIRKKLGERNAAWGGKNEPDVDSTAVKNASMMDLRFLIENIQFQAKVNPESCYSLVRALRKTSNVIRTTVERAKTLRRMAREANQAQATAAAAKPLSVPVQKRMDETPAKASFSGGGFEESKAANGDVMEQDSYNVNATSTDKPAEASGDEHQNIPNSQSQEKSEG